ncbi:MAG: MFS transporter, partial [Chloroflexi bacterium]|nr:MFS transporter [Chloroflexota bacterium]
MPRSYRRIGGRPGTRIFYGWWMVAAGAVTQAYVGGTFWQGFGAFFDPIVAHFGWSRAATAGALSLQRLEAGLISPFVGIFINRYGPRRVILCGVLVSGLGFVFLSQTHSLWQFYVAMSVIGIGLEFGSFFAIGITVANWFVVKRAMAMSLFTAGTGLGGLLVPVVVALIALTDWRMGLLVVGVGFWVIGIPVALIMRSRPEEYGLLPDGGAADADVPSSGDGTGRQEDAVPVTSVRSLSASGEPSFTLRQALVTRSFWQLSLALGVTQLTMSASVHHIPALADFGVSRATAGLVIMGVSMVSLASRLGTALVGDRLDK